MAANEINAKQLLLGDTPSAAVSMCAGAAIAEVKTNPVTIAAHVDWSGVVADIGTKIEEMLDINLAAAIADAWRDVEEVKACADPTKHPPDETIFLPMAEHDIEASLKPYL